MATAKELKAAAVEALTATKYICKQSKCNTCRLHKYCGVRAPEGLTEEEINEIADNIAVMAETEE